MKKILKWFAISVGGLLGLIIIALTIAVFVVDLNKYRPEIEKVVEEQIRGDFTLGEIKLSAWPYLGVALRGISIKNLPSPQSSFDGSEVLALNEAALKIHMKSLISGKLVASFVLLEPKINMIANKDGMNVTDILPPTKEEVKVESEALDLGAISSNPWLARILIEKIGIKEGSIHFIDPSVAGAEPLVLSPLTISLSDIQLTDSNKPIRFLLETVFKKVSLKLTSGIWIDLQNENLRIGEGKLNIGGEVTTMEVTLKKFMSASPKFSVKIDSPKFDLDAIAPLLTLPPNTTVSAKPSLNLTVSGTPTEIDAIVVLDMEKTKVVSDGTPISMDKHTTTIRAKGQTINPKLVGKTMVKKLMYDTYEVTNLDLEYDYENLTATLSKASLSIFDGFVDMKGSVNLGEMGPYDLVLDVKDINISKTTNLATGTAFFKTSMRGQGLDMTSMQGNLNGDGNLKLVDGKINSVNLVDSVFSKKIVGLVEKGLKGKDQTVALPGSKEEGTSYKKIEIPYRIENGRLIIDQMAMEGAGYHGEMNGSAGLDQTLDLKGRLYLEREQSEQLISSSDVRGYVTDKEARFVVPFKVTGTFSDPKVRPDEGYVKELFARAAQRIIKSKAAEALKQKLLKQPTSPAAPSVPSEDVEKKAKSLLKGIF